MDLNLEGNESKFKLTVDDLDIKIADEDIKIGMYVKAKDETPLDIPEAGIQLTLNF